MSRKIDFLPVEKDHNNFTFKAPAGMSNCNDLKVTKIDDNIVTVWRLSSFIQRIKFFFNPEITLLIHGEGMPPVSIMNSDQVITK